jgi:hypothetical protein
MSETVTYIGKLKKVELHDKTVEEWCDEKCRELDIKIGDFYQTSREALISEKYNQYFFHGGNIWEAIENKRIDYEDICFMSQNSDGTYNFVMQFYNGGTCLSEMIDEGLKKLD